MKASNSIFGKNWRSSLICLIPGALLLCGMLFILYAEMYANNYFNYHGFAIDEHGAVYVGGSKAVEVTRDGERLQTFYLPQEKKYVFALKQGTFHVWTPSVHITLDKNGNELTRESCHDTLFQEKQRMIESQKIVSGEDGFTYQYKRGVVTDKIIRINESDSKTVYQSSAFHVYSRFHQKFFFIVAAILVIIMQNLLAKANGYRNFVDGLDSEWRGRQ